MYLPNFGDDFPLSPVKHSRYNTLAFGWGQPFTEILCRVRRGKRDLGADRIVELR